MTKRITKLQITSCCVVVSYAIYRLLHLLVYVPEFFLTPNSTVEANHSTSLVLTCVAFGVPVPSVRWERRDGQSLESANISFESLNLAGTEFVTSTLELCRVEQSDGGLYSCIASNSVGENQYNFTIVLLLGKDSLPPRSMNSSSFTLCFPSFRISNYHKLYFGTRNGSFSHRELRCHIRL